MYISKSKNVFCVSSVFKIAKCYLHVSTKLKNTDVTIELCILNIFNAIFYRTLTRNLDEFGRIGQPCNKKQDFFYSFLLSFVKVMWVLWKLLLFIM